MTVDALTRRITTERPVGRGIARLCFALAVGVLFLVASLPDSTTALSAQGGWEWLAEPALASQWLDTTLSGLPELLTWLGYAAAAYFAALLVISVRHWRPGLFAIGVVVAVGTAVLLHVLGWIGFVLFKVGAFLVDVVSVVLGFFSDIGRAIGEFVAFAFDSTLWIGLLGGLVVLALILFYTAKKWLGVALLVLVVVVILGVFAWLGSLVPHTFWPEARDVVGVVFAVLLGLLAVATVGQLFLDQLRSTVTAGSDTVGVAMGAIAVGSAFAMLMLIGNVFGAYSWYPGEIVAWLQTHLQSNGTPNLDIAIALVVVGLSAIGVLRNLVRLKPAPDLAEFRRSLVYAIMGAIAATVIGSVAHAAEH